MGLMGLLLVNGGLLRRAEHRARRGASAAWEALRTASFASLALWFLITLAGVRADESFMKLDVPCQRRTFLQAACFTLSAAALGLNAADTSALPIEEGDGQQSGNEVRFPIPAADGVTIDRKVQVIIVRYQSRLYAFNLACPHENNVLKWLPKDGRFQCTKHDSQYNARRRLHKRPGNAQHGSARRAQGREYARRRVKQVLSV